MFSGEGLHGHHSRPFQQAPVQRACARACSLPFFSFRSVVLFCLLLLPGILLAAESAEEEEQLPFGFVDRIEPEPYADQADTHAGRPASPELMRLASQEPEQFVGKTVMFEDGRPIGHVMHVRRHMDDQDIYLILDATEFFNNPTEYAVPARDMQTMQDEILIIAEYTGMHLRGRQYYEAEYEDVDNTPFGDDLPEEDSAD